MCTKFDIHVFIAITGSIPLLVDYYSTRVSFTQYSQFFGPNVAFLGPWLNETDLYLDFFVLKITELKDNVIYNVFSSVSNQSLAKVTLMNLPIKSSPNNMNQEPSRL